MLWRSSCFQGPRARRPRDSRRDPSASLRAGCRCYVFDGATFSAALLFRRYPFGGLSLRGRLAQASNLFHVMQAVNEMKLSPLGSGEGAEDRMVQQFAARAQLLFATRNAVVHFGYFQCDLGDHFFWRQSARTRYRRGFSACGKIAEPHDDQLPAALAPAWSCDEQVCRLRLRAQILSPFRCRSDTDAPGFRRHTTFPADAGSTA